MRTYSVESLRELGYRVLEAHDGPSALRLARAPAARRPAVHRRRAARRHDRRAGRGAGASCGPQLKVLFTTGYARNAIVHHGRLDAGVQLITKPFSFATWPPRSATCWTRSKNRAS